MGSRGGLFTLTTLGRFYTLAQFYPVILYDSPVTPSWLISVALDELKLISAFMLAIVMYYLSRIQSNQPQPQIPNYPQHKKLFIRR